MLPQDVFSYHISIYFWILDPFQAGNNKVKLDFVFGDLFHGIATKAEENFQIRKALDFVITKSFLDVAEINPAMSSTAPSPRFAILRTAGTRVCDITFLRPIKG